MEKIKNKIFIRSILVTLSLVLCFSFGLVLFKDNVNVVSADSVEVELDSQVNKVTATSTAPTIDASYFNVTSPDWSSKIDLFAKVDHFHSNNPSTLYLDVGNFNEFAVTSNVYAHFYYPTYNVNGDVIGVSSKNDAFTSYGYTDTDNVYSLYLSYRNYGVSYSSYLVAQWPEFIIVFLYNSKYYVVSSPLLTSSYNAYIKGNLGSSLSENEIYQNGYNVGYNKGFNDGNNNVINNPNNYDLYSKTQYDNNYNTGKTDGITIGENNVKDNPNNYDLYNQTQYDSNYTNGKNVGYSTGYNKGVADSNDYTFIGLIGSVIDAPIQAFTSLFNFDLLGFNLLNFVKALFTLMVIIVVARFIVAKM